MALPILHLQGTPYEQGIAHGQQLKDRILNNLDVYFERFAKEVGLSRGQVLDCAAQFLAALPRQNAEYYEGVKGIAQGAGVELAALAALNVRYEILYYQFGVQAMADGCTAFVVLPEASADGHLRLGQNWDWIPQVQGAVIHSTEPDGFKVAGFTEAGIFGRKIGLNSAGLGLVINGMTSTDDNWHRVQKPFHVRCHEILKSKSMDEATHVVTGQQRTCAANFMIAQAPDQAVDLEAAPAEVGRLYCTQGRMAHTNHFLEPKPLGIKEPPMDNRPHSKERQARMTWLLHAKKQLACKDLKGFLADRQGFPYSINRHEDPNLPAQERYTTVTSVIMDLHAGEIQLTDGPPDLSAYQKVTL